MDDRFQGLVFTGGPLYSDLLKACGTTCDDPPDDFPVTSLGCFDAVSRWGVDQGFGQSSNPNIRDSDEDGGCGHMAHDDGGLEECGEDRFAYLCMSHTHEDLNDPHQQAAEDFLEANSIAVELTRWNYDYHDDLGLRFLFGDEDPGSAPIQQSIFHGAVAHNLGVEDPLSVLETGHRVPATTDGRTAIRTALLATCVNTP